MRNDYSDSVIDFLAQLLLVFLVLGCLLGGAFMHCACGDTTRALVHPSSSAPVTAVPDQTGADEPQVVKPSPAEVTATCDMWRYELDIARERGDDAKLHNLIDIRPTGCSPDRK